ncbi:CCC motif membrane protein [Flavobacterium sp. I3-2]|uniref:CCC motif membrane protein n=1 Tax=Flavobacterium sp. I3-2 TaxID=2748319 RepID=UPI0015AB2A34|nr:CCC motif membrane protein [Flavobacterium sp. I3-2]
MENQEFNPYQNQQNDNFVIQQNLPNSTPVLIMGILSILGCCFYGVGVIFGIIGIVLTNKDMKLYNANPSQYKGLSTLNTGKILCIIGLILSAISLIITIYIFAIYGYDNYQNDMLEWSMRMQQDSM